MIKSFSDYRCVVNTANYHNYRYFVLSQPEISDIEFDTLYFSIQQYEEKHPDEVLPDSPTQRVGSDLHSDAHTIPHRTPMLSCQKSKTIDEVLRWMRSTSKRAVRALTYSSPDKIEYCVEWKYDGVSCSLVYQDGHLIEASTRGDHVFGKDILHHVMNIPSVPKVLRMGARDNEGRFIPSLLFSQSHRGRLEVRGEIILPFASLAATKSYNDTRTAVSAILNTDSETPYDHLLQFRAWQMIADECDNVSPAFYRYETTALSNLYDLLGFDIEEWDVATIDNIEQLITAYTAARPDNVFPTDGLVIKLNDTSIWQAMGATDHHPKYSLAYKFAAQTAVTYCEALSFTIGEKTGKLTHIAHFAPVTIGGKTYEKCSIGGDAALRRLGIKVGSKVQVSLRNDVLLQIDHVITQ